MTKARDSQVVKLLYDQPVSVYTYLKRYRAVVAMPSSLAILFSVEIVWLNLQAEVKP